ncbi:50S ribosomal protein L9, putative [Babesia ovis]|uniref:50S ribosomal protein L9, putative n=1 Tax=Babesia ovis TaxID=5869 RepID=A0A9W5TDY6_BABOV|nr:50S ribosomal protein L9, putative [Babesia ovis]
MISKCSFNAVFRRYKISAVRPTISRRTLYPRTIDREVDVVLLRDFPSLGKKGEIVKTARGFANYHLIPHGIAVYSTWENVDLYAHTPNESRLINRNAGSAKLRGDGIDISGSFADNINQLKVSIKVKTLTKDRGVLSTPLSMFRVLDLVSKEHMIDLVPSKVVSVIRNGDAKPYEDATKLGLAGEYIITVKTDMVSSETNVLTIMLTLMDDNDSESSTVLTNFRLPKYQTN